MINKRWKRGFQAAKAASVHSNGVSSGKRMGAALFSGSILVAIGFNTYNQTHPDSHRTSIHAEHKAALKRQHYDNRNLTVYVWREVGGKPACSKPCYNCMNILGEAGVSKVRYINKYGDFVEGII